MSKPDSNHIVLIAGEVSGDMHTAHLVNELKSLNPNLTFSGLGGPLMAAEGVELYEDLTRIAVVGFVEVLKHYPQFKKAFKRALAEIKQRKPAAVILVDYPGFNMRLAKALHAMDVKVIYYISPQVWAWKKNRVYAIKKYVDKMLVLFKFEEAFYQPYDVHAVFVGHPLIDAVKPQTTRDAFLQTIGLPKDNLTIGLLAGSRPKEIERHLPVMCEALAILKAKYPALQGIVIKAPSIDHSLISAQLKQHNLISPIVEDNHYNAVHACDICMVASGTATLETAILGKPMVVVYKTSFLTWLLVKIFIKIPNIGMVNIVAGKKIVPECVQFQATGPAIAEALEGLFTNEPRLARIKDQLTQVKDSLGSGGASRNAAQEILNTL